MERVNNDRTDLIRARYRVLFRGKKTHLPLPSPSPGRELPYTWTANYGTRCGVNQEWLDLPEN